MFRIGIFKGGGVEEQELFRNRTVKMRGHLGTGLLGSGDI